MLTKNEKARLERIKKRALAGMYVSDAAKQWCLDLAARELTPMPRHAIDAAAERGFNTAGIITN